MSKFLRLWDLHDDHHFGAARLTLTTSSSRERIIRRSVRGRCRAATSSCLPRRAAGLGRIQIIRRRARRAGASGAGRPGLTLLRLCGRVALRRASGARLYGGNGHGHSLRDRLRLRALRLRRAERRVDAERLLIAARRLVVLALILEAKTAAIRQERLQRSRGTLLDRVPFCGRQCDTETVEQLQHDDLLDVEELLERVLIRGAS